MRETRPDEKDGILEWVLPMRHSLCTRLRVKLVANDTKDHRGKCSIEVWAEDEYTDEVTEMAYCRGMLCQTDSRVIILWLGRSNTRTVHSRARARRVVEADGGKYTLAEALMGLVVSIASLFKVSTLELQAKDNGTGKLIDLYLRLGFTKRPQAPGEIVWMEAPVDLVTPISPASWLSGLMPESFDACTWMCDVLRRQQFKAALSEACKETVRWDLKWPASASVNVNLTPCYTGAFRSGDVTRVLLEAAVVGACEETLAWASANVRLDCEFCRLLWLGRHKSGAAHASVKGLCMYEVSSKIDKLADCEAVTSVTASIALLGVIAALAHRLGAKMFHVGVPDDESGRLADYFRGFSFVDTAGGPSDAMQPPSRGDAPQLSALCSTVMKNCLPGAWEDKVPLGRLRALMEFTATPSSATLQSKCVSKPRRLRPASEAKEKPGVTAASPEDTKAPSSVQLASDAVLPSDSKKSVRGVGEAPLAPKEAQHELPQEFSSTLAQTSTVAAHTEADSPEGSPTQCIAQLQFQSPLARLKAHTAASPSLVKASNRLSLTCTDQAAGETLSQKRSKGTSANDTSGPLKELHNRRRRLLLS